MKKTAIWLSAFLACSLIGFGQEIQIKDQAAFSYAYLDGQGSYQQIPRKIMEFMGAFFKQGLQPAGPPFGIYFNAPGQVPETELKWLIGMPVAPAAAPVDPLKKGEFKAGSVAVCVHVGPYDNVAETYAKMTVFIDANGWKVAGPPLERYIDNPQMVAADKVRTEIVLPVEKK